MILHLNFFNSPANAGLFFAFLLSNDFPVFVSLSFADDSAPDPMLFSRNFRDVKGSSIEYTYDANGNLTKDLNKGITQIQYNSLNLPKKVNFNHTGQPENEYTYAVDGSKLQVNHKKSSGGYVGNMIYEGGSLKRILVDGGFYEEGKYTST